mgnify:CR=1 FL=1
MRIFCYFFFSREEMMTVKEKYDFNDSDISLAPFSSLGRAIKAEGIVSLYNNSSSNELLHNQLGEIIESRRLVIKSREKLNLRPSDFAKIFSSRPTDINMWQSMLAKPDSFKLEIMEYILSIKDISGNHFIKYLISKAKKYFKVIIINNTTQVNLAGYTKEYNDEISAYEYFDKLIKDSAFSGLNMEVQIINPFGEIIKKHSFL